MSYDKPTLDTIERTEQPSSSRAVRLAKLMPFAVAGLLLVSAGILKLLDQTHLNLQSAIQAAGEIAVGGLIIVFAKRYTLQVVAFLTFAVLSAVALQKSWLGQADCGCFGQIAVPATLIALLDCTLAAIMLILVAKGFRASTHAVRGRTILGQSVVVAAYAVALIGMATTSSAPAANTAALDVESWVGNAFPLTEQIQDGHRLAEGSWLVMFHRDGCGQCAEALPGFVTLTSPEQKALVKAQPSKKRATFDGDFLTTSLRAGDDTIIGTPLFVSIKGGVVKSTANALPSKER